MKTTPDHARRLQWLLASQSLALFGSGIVFPFYVLFTKELGANFTEFGLAYALFSLSAAATHWIAGRWSDTLGRRPFLVLNAWGTATLLLLFPMVTAIWQLYALQIALGVFGAMHRTTEKALVADLTDAGTRGRVIGAYHGWVSVFSALAVIASGILIDLLTLSAIFYVASPFLFASGVVALWITEPGRGKGASGG